MKSKWEMYKGKRIFFADYRRLSLGEIKGEAEACIQELQKQPDESVLLLIDSTGLVLAAESLSIFKNMSKNLKNYIRKTAILGITDTRRVILDMVVGFSGLKIVPFDDIQQAKDWLVSD